MFRILFCKVDEPFGCFSNFSAHPIVLDGLRWPTSEHYFQAAKFLAVDAEHASAIRRAESPIVAARMGRSREHRIRADWETEKDGVMRRAVRAKIEQHEDVRRALAETGDAEIVEHTPRDAYWGDGPDGTGRNMLGRVLMELRAEILEPARTSKPDVGRSVESRCDLSGMVAHPSPSDRSPLAGDGARPGKCSTPEDLDGNHLDGCFLRQMMKPRAGLVDELVARYSEPQRAYHNMVHLSEAYGALAVCGDRVERWDEIKIALWFHDAIYDTHRHDNEERSADWARDELLAAGATADVAARVHGLVLATKHREPPEGNDARLLVDADLSILAAPPDRFATYERQIRAEYDWVPDADFREARERFVRGMLARPSIFSHPVMRERHEANARRNLEQSLRRA